MTHEPENADIPPLVPELVVARLREEPTPRAGLEDDVVARMHDTRVLRGPSRIPTISPWLIAALAAGIAFVVGVSVGRRSATRPLPETTTIDVAGHAVAVQSAPDAPAIAIIRDALDSSIVRAPLIARPAAAPAASRLVTWF
jgi:hypothetical protein